ncbi:DUF5011 domain-containing protein [bacterium]|nr:DUF5011 domain-containing protein [bacterium]
MKQHLTKFWLLAMFVFFGAYSAVAAGLSGKYTIGSGSGYDYSSVSAAASDLMTNGVSGPVTFSIADGTYSGQVTLSKYISGSSSTNTITFEGQSGDSSKVIITNSSSRTIYLYNCDYVTFKDVTIQSTYTSTRYIVYMYYSEHNNFKNCRIMGVANTYTSYGVYSYYSHYNTFANCRVYGNYYGIYFNGSSSTRHKDNVIKNCHVLMHYYYGIYSYYGQGFEIRNCTIDSAQTGIGYGVYQYYSNGSKLIGNTVNTGYYCFYLRYANYSGTITSSDTMRIHNNSLGGCYYYPLYVYYANYVTMYHNSMEAGSGNYAMYYYCYGRSKHRVANNIFVNNGASYGMYVYFGGSSYTPLYWDYNDYYYNSNSYFAYFNGYLVNSLSALQSLFSSKYNQHSLYADPEFSGSDRRTYTPALNNAGVNKTKAAPDLTTDIDGNPRPNPKDSKVDIGPNEYYLAPYDLDVYALVSPLSVNLTKNQITAQFKNAGSKTITKTDVYVQYSVDSGKTWVTDTMTISSLAPGKIQQFDFTKMWKPTRSGKFRVSIKISQSVSGDPDLKDQEDYDICSGLTGTYTIGSRKGADYPSFGAAIKDLKCGVAGPITYYVQAGTYNESLQIGELLGSSSKNTVTFYSPSRDSVTLRSTSGNTITFNGADYVAFENMKIRMDGSSGFTVSVTNNADHNRIENCYIYNNTSLSTSSANAITISGSASSYSQQGKNGYYNEFIDNDIEGGYYGASMYGNGTSNPTLGNRFIRNTFTHQYYYGIYGYYTDSLYIHENHISDFRYTYNYGIAFYYASNFDVQRNYTNAYYYNALYYANYYNHSGSGKSMYANNMMISTGTSYGLYGYRMGFTNFWHNSMYGKGSYLCYWYYMHDNDIRNNIFYFEGTYYAIYTYSPTFDQFDNNDYVIKSGNLASISGTIISNLSGLKAWNSNYNQNSFEEDPKWVNNAKDLHVTKDFPGMYGANLGVADDYDGDKRCSFAPTIGCDEFKQLSLPPTANFLTPDTAWLNSPVVMLNSNKPSKLAGARWYVNGKFASDSIHLEYTPRNTGMDTIKLIMENCSGIDSITKLVYVSRIIRAPKVDFSASSRDVYTGDVLSLLDLTENGATQWYWDISPKVVYVPFLLIWDRTYWFVSGTDSLSANPKLYFQYPGLYKVKLKAANPYGSDSLERTAYIKVRQRSKMCDIPSYTDGKFGTLYDNGGPDGSYSPNLNGLSKCTYLISSCYGEIDFDITQFDVGDGDYLKIYDGEDESGTPLWDAKKYPDGMNGNKNDNSVNLSFTAKSGSAYFVFTSDNSSSTLGKGFAINWEYTPVTWSAPTAAISAPDTVCLGFPTVLSNASTGNYSYVDWDLNGDGKMDASGDQVSYTFGTAGTDTIWLYAQSLCAPKDSTMKIVVVENAKKTAKPDFSASATVVSAGDTVTLTSTANYCASGTRWEITPANYFLMNNGKLSDEYIDVVFTRGGFYTVKVVKSNPAGDDSTTKVNYIQVLDYCKPTVISLDADVAISRVEFGNIDNASSVGKNGYNDFLYMSTTVERGHTYPLTVERKTNNKPMSRKVWIDWNIDGDFDDAGELVVYESADTTMKLTDSITVNPMAKAGKTRMRVAVNYKTLKNVACGPHQFGEFEDYTVVILKDDNTPPMLTLMGKITDSIPVNSTWTEPGYSAFDLVDSNLTSAVQVTSTLNEKMVGVYKITYTVSDKSGNTTSATRTIYVYDAVDPTISLKGDDTVYVQIYTHYTEFGVDAMDNYDTTMSVVTTNPVDTAMLGVYTVNYCTTDKSGNGPVCIDRTVIVMDTIAPMISLIGDDTVEVEVYSFYKDDGYNVVENDAYTEKTTGTWDGTADMLGMFTQVYTVTDNAGNMDSVVRYIKVVDTEAPLIKMKGNWIDTVARWSKYMDAGVEVSDNYYAVADLTVDTGGTFVNTQSEGAYTITYMAMDPSNNTSTVLTRLVIVMEDGTGIGEVPNDGFVVYPNPSTGSFNVATSLDNGASAQLRVLDLAGREIYNAGNFVVSNGKFIVDLSALSSGTYYLQIAHDDAQVVKQIVIAQ